MARTPTWYSIRKRLEAGEVKANNELERFLTSLASFFNCIDIWYQTSEEDSNIVECQIIYLQADSTFTASTSWEENGERPKFWMQLKGTVAEIRATFISLLPRLSRLHSEKRHGEWNFGSTQPYEGQGAIQTVDGSGNVILSGRFGDLTVYGNNSNEIDWETITWAFDVCSVQANVGPNAGLCIEQPGMTERICNCLSGSSCGTCVLGGCGNVWDAQWPYTEAQCSSDSGRFIPCLTGTSTDPWPCGVDYSQYPQSHWEQVYCDETCSSPCTVDNDCASDQICSNKCCVTKPGDGGEDNACSTSADCESGLECCGDAGKKTCVKGQVTGTCLTSNDFCNNNIFSCAEGIAQCNCNGQNNRFVKGQGLPCDYFTTEEWKEFFGCAKGCCIVIPGGDACSPRVYGSITPEECAAKCASGTCKSQYYEVLDDCACLSQGQQLIKDVCPVGACQSCVDNDDCAGGTCVTIDDTTKCCVGGTVECDKGLVLGSTTPAPSTINVTVTWKYTSGSHMAPGHIAGSKNEDWNSLFWWYPTSNVGSTWIAALTAGNSFAHANFYNQDNGSCTETCSPPANSCDCDAEVCKTVTWTEGNNTRIGKYGDIALSGYSNTDSVGYGTCAVTYSFTRDDGNNIEDIYTIKGTNIDIPHFRNEFSTTTLTKKCCNRNCFRKCSCKDIASTCSNEKSEYSDTQYWRQGKPVVEKLSVPFNSAVLKRKRVSADEAKWEYDIDIKGIANGNSYNIVLNSTAENSGGALTTVFPDSLKHSNDVYNAGYYSSKNYNQYCGQQPRTKDLKATAWKPLSFTIPSPYNTDTNKVTTWGINSAAVLATAEQGKGYLWTPTTGQIDSHQATVVVAEVT